MGFPILRKRGPKKLPWLGKVDGDNPIVFLNLAPSDPTNTILVEKRGEEGPLITGMWMEGLSYLN